MAQEHLALGPAALGEAQKLALERVEAPVDVVQLLDQALDPVGVEVDLVDQLDDLAAGLLVARVELGIERLVALQRREAMLLQRPHPVVGERDLIEGREHAVADRGLHRRQRQGAVVELLLLLGFLALGLGGRLALLGLGLAAVLGLRLGDIGRLEVDDVAQQDLALADRTAPADDRAHGQRAFAQRLEHGVAAGLDPLGDLDLALAREQLDRAHLAQVHAHRVVGAAEILIVDRGGALALLLAALELGLGACAVGAVLLAADGHAHVLEHRDQLFDLVGRDLLLRQGGVDLVDRDHPALAGLDQEPLETRRAGDEILPDRVRPALARHGLDRRGPARDCAFRHSAVPS